MFFNFIQDIEIGGYYNEKFSLYDSICIRHNNEILNVKITINHMDIVDVIENYVKTEDTYNFRVMCEEDVKLLRIRPSFFPFIGKYRLENSIRKTNNYFVPEKTPLLEELIDLYNDNHIYYISLNNLNLINNELIKNNNGTRLLILKKLCSKFSLELLEKYNIESLEKIINYSNNLINKDDLNKMKWILKSSKENELIFNSLGLNEKIKCIEEEKNSIKNR